MVRRNLSHLNVSVRCILLLAVMIFMVSCGNRNRGVPQQDLDVQSKDTVVCGPEVDSSNYVIYNIEDVVERADVVEKEGNIEEVSIKDLFKYRDTINFCMRNDVDVRFHFQDGEQHVSIYSIVGNEISCLMYNRTGSGYRPLYVHELKKIITSIRKQYPDWETAIVARDDEKMGRSLVIFRDRKF